MCTKLGEVPPVLARAFESQISVPLDVDDVDVYRALCLLLPILSACRCSSCKTATTSCIALPIIVMLSINTDERVHE